MMVRLGNDTVASFLALLHAKWSWLSAGRSVFRLLLLLQYLPSLEETDLVPLLKGLHFSCAIRLGAVTVLIDNALLHGLNLH